MTEVRKSQRRQAAHGKPNKDESDRESLERERVIRWLALSGFSLGLGGRAYARSGHDTSY
jgi:hypothetical protein